MGEIKDIVTEYLNLDDDLKKVRVRNSTLRKSFNKRRTMIIDYMVNNKIDRMDGLRNNTQYLECQKKSLKCRAKKDQMITTMKEILKTNERNPSVIIEEIINAGGQKEEYRLFRRSHRVSAKLLFKEKNSTDDSM
jgi:hypothetical protein